MWKEKEFAYGVKTESKKEVLCENAKLQDRKEERKENEGLCFLEQSKKSESKIKEKKNLRHPVRMGGDFLSEKN